MLRRRTRQIFFAQSFPHLECTNVVAPAAPQAQVKRGRPVAAEYDLDVLGNKPQLSLPTHSREGGVAASHLAGPPAASHRGLIGSRHARDKAARQGANSSGGGGGGGGELSEGVREKLATVLAKEFSRKVRDHGLHSYWGSGIDKLATALARRSPTCQEVRGQFQKRGRAAVLLGAKPRRNCTSADPSRLAALWHVGGLVYEVDYRCRMQHNVCQHDSMPFTNAASGVGRGLPPPACMHVDVHMQLHLIALPLHSLGVCDGILGWADAGAAAVGRAQRHIVRGGAVGAGPGGAPQAGAQQGLGTIGRGWL